MFAKNIFKKSGCMQKKKKKKKKGKIMPCYHFGNESNNVKQWTFPNYLGKMP